MNKPTHPPTPHPPTAPAEVGQSLDGLDPRRLAERAFTGITEPHILREDNAIVCVIKPAGMLSTPDEKGEKPNLVSWLAAACGTLVYPVHRLDEAAAGVMVYAKSAPGAAALTKSLTAGEWEKEYLALCHGDAVETLGTPAGTLSDLLFRDAARNKSYVVKRKRKGVREALLSYRVLAVWQSPLCLSLVAVRLATGRTHQIRVQFASRGLPLVSDSRYGGGKFSPTADRPAGGQGHNIALFSYRLAFPHPDTNESITLNALPDIPL